jgi:hypothetical protein
VIQKQKKNNRFSDKFEHFIGEKPILMKKKFRRSAVYHDFIVVQMKILSARILKVPFKLETPLFGKRNELV